jgi:epoxyqueuosine reductase
MARQIRRKALELGIAALGVARVQAMDGCQARVEERIALAPGGAGMYRRLAPLIDVGRTRPWAGSIVVAAMDIARYRVPEAASGRWGRLYLADSRRNPAAPESAMIRALSAFMEDRGLKIEWNEHPGVTALRWAARAAGLGVIRRNNFFYAGRLGSFASLTAWVADREMELPGDDGLEPGSDSDGLSDSAAPEEAGSGGPEPGGSSDAAATAGGGGPCPDGCGLCQAACPTGALMGPWLMTPDRCVSPLTSLNDPVEIDPAVERAMGGWLYGCDACQEACPRNKAPAKAGREDFPGLSDLAPLLTAEAVAAMGYGEIAQRLAPKFFYIGDQSLWRWKLNAIRVLVNTASPAAPRILADLAAGDPHPIVRRRAERGLAELSS